MERVVIFKNGSNENSKVIGIPNSFEELKIVAGDKLGFYVERIFTAQGGEIDDVKLIRDNESLYASAGEAFIELTNWNTARTSFLDSQSNNQKKKCTEETNFRDKLQDYIDSNIQPKCRYEASKLLAYAVEIFVIFSKDSQHKFKEIKQLEKDVVGRGVIEIIEERFLGNRRSTKLKNLSHQEKMKKVLTMPHPTIGEIKKLIAGDEELTIEDFPYYSAVAHEHFSSRIHQYIHNKKKLDMEYMNKMSGVFPGRYKAYKAVNILFQSICNTSDDYKKFFTNQLDMSIDKSGVNCHINVSNLEKSSVNRHNKFLYDKDGRSIGEKTVGRKRRYAESSSNNSSKDGALRKKQQSSTM